MNLRGIGHAVYNICQQINGQTVVHTHSTMLSRNKKELSIHALPEMTQNNYADKRNEAKKIYPA